MPYKTLPLYVKILTGMALGITVGMLALHLNWTQGVTQWVKPFGEIFMRLLKFIAIPLVLVSLIKGVANLSDMASLSKIGLRTILLYLATTVFSITLGLVLVNLIVPGRTVSAESSTAMKTSYHATVTERAAAADQLANTPPLQFLVNLFPDNFFQALSHNGGMLQVIVIALLIGLAMLLVGREKSAPFARLLDSLDAIILKLVDLIMEFAPFGVLALMAGMIVDTAGNLNLLSALGLYAGTVVLGLLLLIFGVYPLLVHLFSNISARRFIKTMTPVQLLAFTTSSSAATLPLNLETAEKKLGISQRVASFVLPVGMTINMDGTSLYQAVAAVFIAQVLGIELSWTQMLIIVTTTTLSSIGTPGIPGGSIVVLVMVLSSVGIPAEGLALILGLDRPLDMLRTVANVTGDAAVASIVDHSTP